MKRVLVLLALLCSTAAAQDVQDVVFSTWPTGARVYMKELDGQNRFLGYSGQPISLDLGELMRQGGAVSFRFKLDGYHPREEATSVFFFTGKTRYPDEPIRLQPEIPVVIDIYYWAAENPGLAAAAAGFTGYLLFGWYLPNRRRVKSAVKAAGIVETLTAANTPADGLLGRVLGRWRLTEVLNRGGIATLYKAEGVGDEPGGPFVVKVLRTEPGHASQFAERFLREIRICSQLDHPQLARILDWGEVEGNLYLVRKRIQGEDLRSRIRPNGMDIEESVRILTDVADVAAYLHQNGVVHRNLKPENVLVDTHGRVWLTDLGIAWSPRYVQITQVGTALGSPAYMSPEQVRGERADARSDQYALGVLAFEMLCGRPPFDDESPVRLAYQKTHQDPPSPRTLRSEIPPPLEAVVLRLLSLDPTDRYPTMKVAQKRLREALVTFKYGV